MTTLTAKKVKAVLRTLGFRPAGTGHGDGHELWLDEFGRRAHPVFRKKTIYISIAYSLGLQLESQGVIGRRKFVQLLQ